MTDQHQPFEEYEPARSEGDIVPLEALLDPAGHCPDLAAASEPHPDLRGFRLLGCRCGPGKHPCEGWTVQAIGGPHDGQCGIAYVYLPGHEPK